MNKERLFKDFIKFYKFDILNRSLMISKDYLNYNCHFEHKLLKLLISRDFYLYISNRRNIDIEKELTLQSISSLLFDYYEFVHN